MEGTCFQRGLYQDGCGVSRRHSSYRAWLAACTLLYSIAAGCSNLVSPDAKIDRLMDETAARLHTLSDVRAVQSQFRSRPDSSVGIPTASRVFRNGLAGDCASAAVLGQWSLAQIGIPATVYAMWNPAHEWGHMITISDDGAILISNRDVIELHGDPLELWGGAYTRIVAVKEAE